MIIVKFDTSNLIMNINFLVKITDVKWYTVNELCNLINFEQHDQETAMNFGFNWLKQIKNLLEKNKNQMLICERKPHTKEVNFSFAKYDHTILTEDFLKKTFNYH